MCSKEFGITPLNTGSDRTPKNKINAVFTCIFNIIKIKLIIKRQDCHSCRNFKIIFLKGEKLEKAIRLTFMKG